MEKDNATLNVPTDVLRPIIDAHVTKAVIEALGGRDDILHKAIQFFMNVRVDSNGVVSNYSSSNNTPWIQWAVMDCIQKAAKEAITAHLSANVEVLKKQLVAELRNSRSPMAKQLAEGMVNALASPETLKWRLEVKCNV